MALQGSDEGCLRRKELSHVKAQGCCYDLRSSDERVKMLNLCALLQGMNTIYCKTHIYICIHIYVQYSTLVRKVGIEGGPGLGLGGPVSCHSSRAEFRGHVNDEPQCIIAQTQAN